MKIAIVGSRTYTNKPLVHRVVARLPRDSHIISGGAIGPDMWAVEAASIYGLTWEVIEPDYKQYARYVAPLVRNREIITKCDHLIAFMNYEDDTYSSGTMNAIGHAVCQSKVYMIYHADYKDDEQ